MPEERETPKPEQKEQKGLVVGFSLLH